MKNEKEHCGSCEECSFESRNGHSYKCSKYSPLPMPEISENYKRKCIGLFATKLEAHKAYLNELQKIYDRKI